MRRLCESKLLRGSQAGRKRRELSIRSAYTIGIKNWVKNCRSKRGIKKCLGGLKCSQNAKKNKKSPKGELQSDIQCTF